MSIKQIETVNSIEQIIEVMESTVAELDNKLDAGIIPVVEIQPPDNSYLTGAYLKRNATFYDEDGTITERERIIVDRNPELQGMKSSILVNTRMGKIVSEQKPDKECFVQLAAHEYAHHISHLDDQYIKNAMDQGLVEYRAMAKKAFKLLPRYDDVGFSFFKRLDENELLMRIPTKGKVAQDIQGDPDVNEAFAKMFGANYSNISRDEAVSIKRDIQRELA